MPYINQARKDMPAQGRVNVIAVERRGVKMVAVMKAIQDEPTRSQSNDRRSKIYIVLEGLAV